MAIPRAKLNGLLLMCELVPSTVNALKPIYIFIFIFISGKTGIIFCWVKNSSEIHKPYPQIRFNYMRKVVRDFSSLKLIPS